MVRKASLFVIGEPHELPACLDPEPMRSKRPASEAMNMDNAKDRVGTLRPGSRVELDDEGREWLAWALEEFRRNRSGPVLPALAARTLRAIEPIVEVYDANDDG